MVYDNPRHLSHVRGGGREASPRTHARTHTRATCMEGLTACIPLLGMMKGGACALPPDPPLLQAAQRRHRAHARAGRGDLPMLYVNPFWERARLRMAARVFEGHVSLTRKECLREGVDLLTYLTYRTQFPILCKNKQHSHSRYRTRST